jgi:hypothetical protein
MRELEDGDQTQPASIASDALLPLEIRNPLRKLIAPRQHNPALFHLEKFVLVGRVKGLVRAP